MLSPRHRRERGQEVVVQHSHLTPKAVVDDAPGKGRGAFAAAWIGRGEVVSVFGGLVAERHEIDRLGRAERSLAIQVDEDLFLVTPEFSPGDALNHSCAPNCGMRGANIVVAMRDIAPGEELTYDYATSDGSSYDEFECGCATASCRGKVTGEDWMSPELQLRYRGFFSPYLANRIAALAPTAATRRAFSY
jgi:uncharacterized protein